MKNKFPYKKYFRLRYMLLEPKGFITPHHDSDTNKLSPTHRNTDPLPPLPRITPPHFIYFVIIFRFLLFANMQFKTSFLSIGNDLINLGIFLFSFLKKKLFFL